MSSILDQAQKLQAKRATTSDGSSGPAGKRQKAAHDLVNLITAVAGGRDASAGGSLEVSLEPDDDLGDDQLDFLGAPAAGSAEPLSLLSKRQPGRLFALGLRRVRDRLAALQGGGRTDASTQAEMGRMMSFYHTVICKPAHPQMTAHTSREMETLAELVDCLLEGDLDRCGDVALQRYKALEMSLSDGSWEIARELEVVDRQAPYLASEEERHRGSRRRLQEVRLNNALASLRQRAAPAMADR